MKPDDTKRTLRATAIPSRGSKVIDKLTDETAPKAKEITFRLRDVGYMRAISIVGSELTRQLAERQRRLESGESSQVGVNAFLGEIGLTPRHAIWSTGFRP